MAVFPYLDVEPTVQVGDRTRIDASKTFYTPGSGDVLLFEIDAGAGFIDVRADQYLDFAFGSSGVATIECRVVTAGTPNVTGTASAEITVVTKAQDGLWSTDADLKLHEPDILKWVEEGRNTFLNMHRRAKILMLDYLAREGYRNWNYTPLTGDEIYNVDDVRQWATFTTLRLIFEGMSNATEDIFHVKSLRYSDMEMKWRSTVMLRLKVPNVTSDLPGAIANTRVCTLIRR